MPGLPERASIVVVGAGIVGVSAAWHLARRNWTDVVVLDQGPLGETGGSTSHAPGLVFQTNSSRMLTELARESMRHYAMLAAGGDRCFNQVGSLEVARTPERWLDLRRKRGLAQSWGVAAELLEPDEVCRLVPLINPRRILGAYHVAGDGLAKAVRACEVMAADISQRAGSLFGNTSVTGFSIRNGRIEGVETSRGRIATELVLICAGIWGPRIGQLAGTVIPLSPVEHLYTRTAPIAELGAEVREAVHPIVRDQDCAMYYRQHGDCYGVGSYRHEPLLVDPASLEAIPAVRPFTPQHFDAARAASAELMPAVGRAPIATAFNGLFSFTPDGFPVLGEAPEVRGLWVAEAIWVTHAPGAAMVIADWIDQGRPTLDVREAHVRRFHPHALTPAYVRARAAQQYREVYDVIHPAQQIASPRNLRLSPLHERLAALGGVFFESAGWERPQWFERNAPLVSQYQVTNRSGWAARHWSPIQGAEHLATRGGVALFDLSPFTKIEITGPGALGLLERIAANRVDRPIGTVTYTPLLDERGGILADVTITHVQDQRFWVITGASTGPRDLAWLEQHAPNDGSVEITDVSSTYGTIGMWGPHARHTFQTVSPDDLGNQAFPFYQARRVSICEMQAIALRVSYVGELGWEIYVPAEYAGAVWDALWQAGREFGIIAAGGGAFDSLRLEKGYRLWGTDIHTEYDPFEAGLERSVCFDKGDFLGRAALLTRRGNTPSRRLCCVTLQDDRAVLMGKEPISHDGRVVGFVTSTNYGYSIGRQIAYGYLPGGLAAPETRLTIEYFGESLEAQVVTDPVYDPVGRRMRD